MPGKPSRMAIFGRILTRNPALAIALGAGDPPKLTSKDETAFLEAIVVGLLKRISQLKPEEAEALSKSLPRLSEQFAVQARLGNHAQASKDVAASLSRFSIPQLNRHLIEPTPLELAELADGLSRQMPPIKEVKKRRAWVETFGLHAHDAAESDGKLIEHILANHFNISDSRVHKILARASKFAR